MKIGIKFFFNKNNKLLDKNLKKEIEYLKPFFDRDFYLETYADIKQKNVDPILHYLQFGADEGRNPSPDFNTFAYIQRYPDVVASGINPFLHYVLHGKKEGRVSGSNYYLQITDSIIEQEQHIAEPIPNLSSSFFKNIDSDFLLDRRNLDINQFKKFHYNNFFMDFKKINNEPIKPKNNEIDYTFINDMLPLLKGKILSLDIWDTILRRLCHPDEIKLRSARILWLLGKKHSASIRDLHPVDVMKLRSIAEASVADDNWEYRFSEVVPVWLDMLDLPDDRLSNDIISAELTIEKASAYPDPTIAELINKHSGKTIAISDFYLPSNSLKTLLEYKNVHLNGTIYSSCDVMATKRRGDLFDYVLKQENIKSAEVLHIGDRRDADVEKPRLIGIRSALFESPKNLAHIDEMANCMYAYQNGDMIPHAKNILRQILANNADKNNLPVEGLSVVVVGFILQVLEEAIEHGIECVYFCTREGVFFKEIYDLLVASDVFDLGNYPKSKLLEVSRRSTFTASLETFSINEMMRLWSQYSVQSMRSLAVTLNINIDEWQKNTKRFNIDIDKDIRYPWLDESVKKFFSDPEIQKLARHAIRDQNNALLEYLERIGFAPLEAQKRMIVDIGWRGTIQDNLGKICAGTIHGCYMGLDKFLNYQTPSVTKSAFLMNANISGDTFKIADYAAIEFILNSAGGSVIGYKNGTAQRQIFTGEEKTILEYVLPFQERIKAASLNVVNYIRNHGLISADIKSLAREIITTYIKTPPKDVAKAFISLEHNETFGIGSTDQINNTSSELETLLTYRGADFHYALKQHIDQLRWSEAHFFSGELDNIFKNLKVDQKLCIPNSIFAPMRLSGQVNNSHKICVFSPHPIKGSGGHRTIYNMCRKLSKAGYEVHLMNEYPGNYDAMQWQEEIIQGSGIILHNEWFAGIDAVAAIATIDYSAFYVSEFYKEKAKLFYFVQDYEAKFNPMGDVYLRSQRSYAENLNPITIGRWLSHVLNLQYKTGAASGGLGVDHNIYKIIEQTEKNAISSKKIAFLYQPEKFRRAPNLCIDALIEVKRRIPDVEIITYGSHDQPNLPFEASHYGLISDLNKINEIYNESMLGLCISATNPSRIPFEMMAAGCVPVDIYSYNNLFDYSTGCGVLAYQSPLSLAEAMCKIIEDDDFRKNRRLNGLKNAKARSLDWETDVAANTIGYVLGGGNLNDIAFPEPSYTDKPIISEACKKTGAVAYTDWQWRLANLKS